VTAESQELAETKERNHRRATKDTKVTKPSSFRVLRAFVFLVPFACFVIFLIELFFYGVTVRDVRPKGSSCVEDQDGVMRVQVSDCRLQAGR